jgi:regulator of replication initiation timing
MTEKRFTFADGFKIVAIKDNGKIMNSKQVCNQLNELYDENKELSEQVEYLKKQVKIFRGECNRLTKENTELLEELND